MNDDDQDDPSIDEFDDGDDDAISLDKNPFDPRDIDELPTALPLFPLSGVVLLPETILPLRIFEERYLYMLEHALAHDRLIGIIQPFDIGEEGTSPPPAEAGKKSADKQPKLQKIGTVGRIVRFEENRNGVLEIVLKGLCRFELDTDELLPHGFRVGAVKYQHFCNDLYEDSVDIEGEELARELSDYMEDQGYKISWDDVGPDDMGRVINTICCLVPIPPLEKQALLEIVTLEERMQMLFNIVKMAYFEKTQGDNAKIMH